jgi:CDP-diacylglycerol--glycerol-3-phosphate 3-phosphatidyltransferase
MKQLPLVLIGFRFLLAPIILLLAYFGAQQSGTLIIVLMYLGLFSDILDGIVARKLGVASARLRRMDSQTDMIFWVSIGIATWMLFPELIRSHAASIVTIFIMEGLCYAISLLRFGKETCTHAFLAKMWGLSLLIAFTSLIGFNYAGIPFYTAIVLGIVSHVDRILITLILPRWTHDIPSAYHAYLIRKGIPFKKFKLLN